jgi:asparagine synthase (glutamine-hydrolysing)
MCAQFGRWNFDGAGTPVRYLERVRGMLAPYGPDGEARHCSPGVDLLCRSFATAESPCPELPPLVLPSGEVLTWEGRLDNRSQLAADLGQPPSPGTRDLAMVAAAWERWGWDCLKRLTGDWALTVWSPRDRILLLATDILATRHLCYAVGKNGVQWSSVPDPLILLSERNLTLEEEYLAGWLASFPAAHLTPFREIHRVPPASIVVIRPGSVAVRRYWDFHGTRRIRYAGDAEYEEHFLDLFRQSVQRRLRSNSPVLAELSGGMDSSAVVCIADQQTDTSAGTKIDTVSWYNDDEPHWNERPWFTRVEAQRGQTGLHIDVNSVRPEAEDSGPGFPCRPGASMRRNPVAEFMMSHGHRVLLSGIGGDEFLGGVPTPVPELEDLLVRGKVPSLWRQTRSWALVQRRPWMHLLHDALRGFLPRFLAGAAPRGPIPWLLPDFVQSQRRALGGYRRRLRWTGPLPSFQENTDALEGIRRQLACVDLWPGYPFERRYPFLDRDLLEYLFAIPREQLVRPGQRRSLMRRALRGTVPDAILDRRRKAFVSRAPVEQAEQHLRVLAQSSRLACEEAGILDSVKYRNALCAARAGLEIPLIPLMRTLAVERWLQALGRSGLLDGRLFSTRSRVSTGHSSGNRISELQQAGEAPPCRL